MKKILLKNLILLFIISSFTSGCFFNTKENINKLPDKKFFFTEFQFILTGQTKESAMTFFKEFPVKKIIYMLAEEYNITVDISDYMKFINSGDTAILTPDGSFRIAKHTWNKANKENNRITFTFEQDYLNSDLLKFNLSLYSGNTTLKIFNTEISKKEYIISDLENHFQTGEHSSKQYDENNYDNISPIPGVIDLKSDQIEITLPDDSNII